MGSIATADTLYAVDAPMQDGIADMNALAPMARLMSAGDIMVEYDQNYEHYGVPQPQLLALQLLQTPLGLTDPVSFGSPRPNVSMVSTLNEQDLSVPGRLTWPSPVVTYTVPDPRPMVRGESDGGALVMEGDATGLNNLAGLGLLNTDSAIYYAGTLASDPTRLGSLAAQGAHLVVTDTNRKQAFRWDTLTANAGYTETPGDDPAKTDLSDSPIELFPGTGTSSKTYATYVGALNVTASSYGNSVSYTPEDQAYSAIDGNLDTAWITGTFVPDPAGQWWQAQLGGPVTTDHITLVQPQRGDRSRWVSGVTLTFDGKDPIHFALNAASHQPAGQTLTFPAQTFRTLRVTIDGTTDDTAPPLSAAAVGFSEVEIPGVQVHQVLQMPTQMLSSLGGASQTDRLSVVMTRDRSSSFPPRSDPETTIARTFTLPTARTFTLSGSASLSALIPDDEIDRLVGRTPAAATGLESAYSSGRLPGDLRAVASATVDGDSTSTWQPGLGTSSQLGTTLTYNLTRPQTLSKLTMQVVADGRHSVPTSMTIASGTQVRTITLPPIADSTVPDAVTTVPLSFPALTGQTFVVTFTGVRDEYAANYYSAGPLALPLGIAEIGIPGVKAAPTPALVPGNCVSNLLTIDGQPIDVAVVGPTQRALDNGELQLVPCGADSKGIALSAGTHVVQTAVGHNPPCAGAPSTCTGWNIDQLVLDSAAGGAAGPAATPTDAGTPVLPATQPGPAPKVTQTTSHIDSQTATVTGADAPFELVLGQSVNKGWQAVAEPGRGARAGSHAVDLGPPQLVDGFANGWHVTASDLAAVGGSNFTVTFTWTPQGEIWAALALSAGTLLLCLLVGFLPVRWRRALRGRLPRRLRGTEGPDAPERPGAPFDATELALPTSADRSAGAAPVRRVAVRPGPAHRRRHRRHRPSGGASAGRSGRGCRRDGGTPRALAARRRHRGWRRVHRRRLPQRRPRAAGAPLHARVELGRFVRQRRQPGVAGRRPAAGRRRDLGVRLATQEAPGRPGPARRHGTAARVGARRGRGSHAPNRGRGRARGDVRRVRRRGDGPGHRGVRGARGARGDARSGRPNRKEHPRTPPRRRRPIRQARPEKCPWSPRRRPLRARTARSARRGTPGDAAPSGRRTRTGSRGTRDPRGDAGAGRGAAKECPRRSPSRPRPIRQPRPKRLPLPRQLPGRHPR